MLATLGVPFSWSERLIWFFPCILLAAFGSYYLGKTLFKERKAACITAAAFTLSTFFLKTSTQGLVNLGASFAVAPLVLALLLRAKRERGLRYPVLAGLALWLQGSYDLRFCYLTIMVAIAGWILVSVGSLHHEKRQGLRDAIRWGSYLALSLGIFIGINLFWILPNVMGPGFQLPNTYGQAWWVSILSWDRLVHALTMSQAGWPGQTFLQITSKGPLPINPFFVLIPIIGFGAALAAIRRIRQDHYRATVALAGCALALVGAFLVKGSNRPLGGVYIWLFDHLPGFSMFRSPNKLYLLVVLGYSILFGLASMIAADWLSKKWRNASKFRRELSLNLPPLVLLFVLVLLVLSALSVSLGGASRPVKVTKGYKELNRQIGGDPQYFRTFWLPDVQRFAPEDSLHPAISAKDIFTTDLAPLSSTDKPLSTIKSPLLSGLLDSMTVGKMIVPEDADVPEERFYRGEYFWESQYIKNNFKQEAAAVPGNSRAMHVGGSIVFNRKGGKDHVFLPEQTVGVLGDWNAALATSGAPGFDLNASAYFFSQQGEAVSQSFREGFPTDAFVSGESTNLDAIAPFTSHRSLVPVANAAGVGPDNIWNSIPAGSFAEVYSSVLRARENYDRSLDYGLGGEICTGGYNKPPKDWLKRANRVYTLDTSAKPLQMTTEYKRVRLQKDTSRSWHGRPTILGTLGAARQSVTPLIVYSSDIPSQPLHPYAIQFPIAGKTLRFLQCKIIFLNSIGEWIGDKELFTRSGTFDFREVSGDYITPAYTAFCRFVVVVKEGASFASSWNLGNVDIFDVQRISNHPKFTVQARAGKKGIYHLMVRCNGIEKGGRIALSVDGGREYAIDTYSRAGRMRWFDIGVLKLGAGSHEIEVTNVAGTNVVNTLALATDSELAAAQEHLSAALGGKDVACALDFGRYPEAISYSRSVVTRADTVYCPKDTSLTPAFKSNRSRSRRGASLQIGNTTFDLSRSVVPSGRGWWASPFEIAIPQGLFRATTSYPVTSLVELPGSLTSPGSKLSDWQVTADGVTLSTAAAPSGDRMLAGYIPPGDSAVERVVETKRFPVSGNTDYSTVFTMEGTDCNTVFFCLKVYDKRGKILDFLSLSDKMTGSFAPTTTLRKVRIRDGASYAKLEVVFFANADSPSKWALSGLLFNETSRVNPPISQLVLVPRSLAFPSSPVTADKAADVEITKSAPTNYRVKVSNSVRPFLLIFSERYAPDWELLIDGKAVSPLPAYTLLNSYAIYKKGSYEVTLKYRSQKWVNIGLIPSILTLLACLAFLIISRYRRKRRERGEAARAQNNQPSF